jgi:hypothetical protein
MRPLERAPASGASSSGKLGFAGYININGTLVISTIRQHACVEPADFAGPATPERIWRAMNYADQR